MTKLLTILAAGLLLASSAAWAGYDKDSPSDGNNGKGNDPGNSENAPGHDRASVLNSFVVAGDNVAPGSGNWGGGPGNSGPGDKNGNNDKSKDGGQTPNDDK